MRAASQILNLNEWAIETTGLDGWWACIQFDRAVSWFGRYVESKLSEYEDGKAVYSLVELLGEGDEQQDVHAFIAAFGGALRTVNT
jgi:hypothetical protein